MGKHLDDELSYGNDLSKPKHVRVGNLPRYTVIRFYGGKVGYIERTTSESGSTTASIRMPDGVGFAKDNTSTQIRWKKTLFSNTYVEVIAEPLGEAEEEQERYASAYLKAQGGLKIGIRPDSI